MNNKDNKHPGSIRLDEADYRPGQKDLQDRVIAWLGDAEESPQRTSLAAWLTARGYEDAEEKGSDVVWVCGAQREELLACPAF